jgi:acyl transferase domain-containing protein
LEEFWKLLIEGQDEIGLAPAEGRSGLIRIVQFFQMMPSTYSQGGFLKSRIEDFDGEFFGMSPIPWSCPSWIHSRSDSLFRWRGKLLKMLELILHRRKVQEGASKSLRTSTKFCEALLAMTNALKDAGGRPSDVSFVGTQGTGTQVGDLLEVSAVAEACHSEEWTKPLVIGSVQPNINICFQHEMIPPHRNFPTLNPSTPFSSMQARLELDSLQFELPNTLER